jgi:mannose-6-phosphate isomerase-like protein (cupin superfamily)
MKPIVLGPGEGDRVQLGPSSVVVKAAAGATEGRFALVETTLEPEFTGPRRHRHDETHDMFFVLEGTLTMQFDDERVDLPPGSFVLVPPGTAHTFTNTTDEQVRLLNMNAPGGLDSYLMEMADAMADGVVDPAAIAEIASRYDVAPVD